MKQYCNVNRTLVISSYSSVYGMRHRNLKAPKPCSELMQFIRRNKNNITRLKGKRFFSIGNVASSRQYENLMLPRMSMQGTRAAGFNFEKAHSKVVGAHFFRYEPLNFCLYGAPSATCGLTKLWWNTFICYSSPCLLLRLVAQVNLLNYATPTVSQRYISRTLYPVKPPIHQRSPDDKQK